MKIPLQIKPFPKLPWMSPTKSITHSQPFFRSGFGKYVHRVRYGHIHYHTDGTTHLSLGFWCGGGSFPDRPGAQFFSETLPENVTVCATCEGRAIGAGLTGIREIAGRAVKFSPRP